ncbi:MAG: hypothetical protein RLZZ403_1549, partial [Pseudomonadota bacterium]
MFRFLGCAGGSSALTMLGLFPVIVQSCTTSFAIFCRN